MKSIKQLRETYDLITEKEDTDFRKLTTLVRAGLFDAKKLPLLKRALEKDAGKLTPAERKVLIQLLDSLMSEVLGSQQLYTKVKQNVMTKEEYIEEARRDYYTRFDPRFKKNPKTLPNIIILKRKAMRVYPDNQVVGLYYSQTLDKYISIPFDTGSKKAKHINAVMNEQKKNDEDEKERSVDWRERRQQRYDDKLRNTPLSQLQYGKTKKTADQRIKRVRRIAATDAVNRLSAGDGRGARVAAGYALGSLLTRGKKIPVSSQNTSVTSNQVSEMFRQKLSDKRNKIDEGVWEKSLQLLAKTPVGKRVINNVQGKLQSITGYTKSKLQPQSAPTPGPPVPPPAAAGGSAGATAAGRGTSAPTPAAPTSSSVPSAGGRGSNVTPAGPRQGQGPWKPRQQQSKGEGGKGLRTRGARWARRIGGAAALAAVAGSGAMGATEPKYSSTDIDPQKAKTSNSLRKFDPRENEDAVKSRTVTRKLSQANEHNISLLKKNMINETTSLVLNDGSQVNINRNIAEKIVNLYESLNVKNKKVMLNLLNENHESFKKVLNFTVRQ
jgi:hypothetical protein